MSRTKIKSSGIAAGAITDSDISDVAQGKVTGLASALAGKVDDSQVLTDVPSSALFTDTTYSVGDGGLTQVNFTTADNSKLDGIASSANNYSLPSSVVHDNEKYALHGTDALSISGHTISLNKGDGTSETVVVPDNNTTYSVQDGQLSQINFTSADHSKLNGIESGATADQTAAQLLTAIKTVDGAGSGLDADLLDGQSSAYYTGYADTAVSNLVDSSPAALNTLNELAAALGDDVNHVTTMTNLISAKLSTAGGTMTGVLTANAGVVVDNITIDANKLATSTGNFTIDSASDILLDADGGNINLRDNGVNFGNFNHNGSNLKIQSMVTNGHILLSPNGTGNVGIDCIPDNKFAVKMATDKHIGFSDAQSEVGNVPALVAYTDSGSLASMGFRGTDLRFATGSSERLRIDSSGKVGIGTSPTYALHVKSPATTTVLIDSAGAGYDSQLRFEEDGVFKGATGFDTSLGVVYLNRHGNGTQGLVVDSSGNVGIGTQSPAVNLHINKGSSTHQPAAGVIKNYVAINTDYDSTGLQGIYFSHLDGNWVDGTSGADSQFGMLFGYQNYTRGGLIYDHRGSEMMSLWSSYSPIRFMVPDNAVTSGVPIDSSIKEAMRISLGGNVGIGTNSPNAKLDVNGEVVISPNTDGKDTLKFTTNASNDGRILIKSDTTIKVDIQANGDSFFNGGNVGIGISNPNGERLSIQGAGHTGHGAANTVSLTSIAETVSGNSSGLWFGSMTNENTAVIGSRTASGNIAFQTYSGGWAERMRIDNSGNVGIGNNSPSSMYTTTNNLVIGDSGNSGMTIKSTSGIGAISFADGTSGSERYRGQIAYSHSGDSLRFNTAAAERMRIDSSGRVAIGTSDIENSNTSLTIDVNQSSNNARGLHFYGGADVTNKYISIGRTHTAGNYYINSEVRFGAEVGGNGSSFLSFATGTNNPNEQTGTSERMRIDSSGRVLIGITGASGYGQLETTTFTTEGQCILARTGGEVLVGTASNLVASSNAKFDMVFPDNSGIAMGSAYTYANIYGNGGDLYLRANAYPANTGSTSKIHLQTANGSGGQASDVVIDNGRLGIGTSVTTAGKLTVDMTGVAVSGDTDGATMGANAIINLRNTNGVTNSTIMLLGSDSDSSLGQIASGIGFTRENSADWGTQLRFYTHPTSTSDVDALKERMRIDSSGDVGIGTSSPAARLDVKKTSGSGYAAYIASSVNSSGSDNGLFIGGYDEHSGSKLLNIQSNTITPDGGNYHTRFVVQADGDVGIGGSPVTGASGSTTMHIKGTSSGAYLRLTTDTAGHTASDGLDIILGGGTNPDAYIWNRENGPLKFGTNNTERMTINSSGKISIGNNVPMWSGSYGGALLLKGNNATTDRYAQLGIVDSTGSLVNNGLVVSNIGYVGIGNLTPTAPLEINKSANFYTSSTSSWTNSVYVGTSGKSYTVSLGSSENNYSQQWSVSGSQSWGTCYAHMVGDSGHTHSKDIQFRVNSGYLQFKNISYTTGRSVTVHQLSRST